MLLETRRKRRRTGGGAAFTVADLPRPARRPQQPQPQPQAAQGPTSAPTAATVAALAQEETQDDDTTALTGMRRPSAMAVAPTTTTALTPVPPHSRLVDRRVLLSRASRMQLLLMERLRCVNLRRARRAELLDEIVRLKQIVQELQNDIDATTRSLEQLEQLVQRLQQISFTGTSAAAPGDAGTLREPGALPLVTGIAPGTILWTNPEFASSSRAALLRAEPQPQAAKEDARRATASGCRFASSRGP